LLSNCHSSSDAGRIQSSAVEFESSIFNKDHLTALKPHGQTFSVAPTGVPVNQPSTTNKRGRPLSVHCRRGVLLVKGFTYNEKCKRLGKMASGCITGDRNGYSKKACLISDIVSSLKSHNNQESPGVQTCVQPQKRVADVSMLNDKDMSQLRGESGQMMEHQHNSGDTDFTLTTVCQNAISVVRDSVDTDAVVVQGLGLPQTVHVSSASLNGDDTLLMRKCGFLPNGMKAPAVRRRGRPRKRPLDGTSLSNHGTSGTVPVRKRGRPRKVSSEGSSSLIVENMSEVAKSGKEEECPCVSSTEVGKSDGLKKANEIVLSFTNPNTVVRRRGRPRKVSAEGSSRLIVENMSEVAKSGKEEECPCVSSIEVGKSDGLKKANEIVLSSTNTNTVVRRRGRPRKVSSEGSSSLVAENMSEVTKFPCESGIEVGMSDGLKKASENVLISTNTNTVVRRRGRPRKRPAEAVEAPSLSDKTMSLMGKDGLYEQHDTNTAVVQRQEWPYKRPLEDSSSRDLTLITGMCS